MLSILLLTMNAATVNATEESFNDTVKPFLATYCIKCHGAKKPKGERRFDQLTGKITDDNSLVDFQDILDQLNLSEMPPESSRQPTIDERRAAIEWLTHQIAEYHRSAQRTLKPVLRRLNAREYRNTVRDLFHFNMTMFDPTAVFPRDQTLNHIDTNGQTLVTSGHLLAKYLSAAETVVDRAMTPLSKPKVQTWKFRDGFKQQPEIDQVYGKTNKYSHITLLDVPGADKPEGAYGSIRGFKEGVPVDGYYQIRFDATALNRINPYDSAYLGQNEDDLLQLEIVAGDYRVGDLHKTQPVEPTLARFELNDGQQECNATIWLDKGFTPRFTFPNGQMDIRNLYARILKKYPKLFPKPNRKGIVGNRFTVLKFGKLPQIHIDNIEIKGPIYESWPTDSQQALLGDAWTKAVEEDELTDEQVKASLKKFMRRAYRGDVDDSEIVRVMELIHSRQRAGRSRLQAYGDGVKSVLCSPRFLFLEQMDPEPTKTGGDRKHISQTALATRLSHFLWSSMPDDTLLESARNGQLHQTLESEVDRMLDDPKSNAFINGFIDSWLTLRDLGATPPDRDSFKPFYQYGLHKAMREETRLFTRHILDENLPIDCFLDADFTFVNRGLARLYQFDRPESSGFHKVSIRDQRRGGLLGQASVLTVSANGVDTSPVVRGVWLLENILGTPPSPPPPDVEPLDPDVRGAKTIRDQLTKHRSVASCNDCHQKIDPLGFALENFDPIGRWRENYERRQPIDASGQLPGGQSFKDVVGFKQILLKQRQQFAKALTEKLLEYAIGRKLQPLDRPHVDAILKRHASDGGGMKRLIQLVVGSKPFQS